MYVENARLEKLLAHPVLDEKDRYEIRQIFSFVDQTRKMNIIANFEILLGKIVALKDDMVGQQKFLLGKAIDNIYRSAKKVNQNAVKNTTSHQVQKLRNIL